MPQSRELIYLNFEEKENCVFSYSIEFKELMSSLQKPIRNILQLSGRFYGGYWNRNTRLEYVTLKDMEELFKEKIYNYGDFAWVDFEKEDDLKKLSPQEIAELLYLGHLFTPVKKPFFQTLNNRIAYLAHDDGWYNKTFYKNMNDFYSMLGDLLPKRIKKDLKGSFRQPLPNIPEELCKELTNFSKQGLVIDLDNINYWPRSGVYIPIYCIGKFEDMDAMYNDIQRHVHRASKAACLAFNKDKKWVVEDNDYRDSF